jgi:Fic family protein
MEAASLAGSPSGRLVPTDGGQQAFVPDLLPRHIELDSSVVFRLDEASRAAATLAGVGETLQNPHLLIRPFMRREAVLSSRIEGTQASISDLLLYEASGSRRPRGDVVEVTNYVLALEHGLQLLDSLPISYRLMNEVHAVLMRGVRGEGQRPGGLRTNQNWIGSSGTPIDEARYIPPPANLVRDLIQDWESFANDDLEMPPLIKCALMHYQFEAIHPYLDGNGRVGRLLVVLFLCATKILPSPLLYLSAYFERDRNEYYDQLFRVSATGDWQTWLRYFLDGVAEQARDALARSRGIRELHEQYRLLLQHRRASGNALQLMDNLFASPYMTAPLAAVLLGVTNAGARGILGRLTGAGILGEIPDTWPRLYIARELLGLIEDPIDSP